MALLLGELVFFCILEYQVWRNIWQKNYRDKRWRGHQIHGEDEHAVNEEGQGSSHDEDEAAFGGQGQSHGTDGGGYPLSGSRIFKNFINSIPNSMPKWNSSAKVAHLCFSLLRQTTLNLTRSTRRTRRHILSNLKPFFNTILVCRRKTAQLAPRDSCNHSSWSSDCPWSFSHDSTTDRRGQIWRIELSLDLSKSFTVPSSHSG